MAKVNVFAPKQSKESILSRLRKLEPSSNADQFKFKNAGDEISARYLGRRLNVQTKNMTDPANILDVEILKSIVDGEEGPVGKHGIFESTGISSIMNGENLSTGDVFYLRFDSVDRKSRFKRFAFKKLNEAEVIELEKELDDIPH